MWWNMQNSAYRRVASYMGTDVQSLKANLHALECESVTLKGASPMARTMGHNQGCHLKKAKRKFVSITPELTRKFSADRCLGTTNGW
jgi:hypothetical protein